MTHLQSLRCQRSEGFVSVPSPSCDMGMTFQFFVAGI